MSDKLQLQVVTRTRTVVKAEVDEVRLPGALGELGVLPGHTGLLTTLATGELYYRSGRDGEYLVVQGGFAEILDNKVTVLADIAETPAEIDMEAAKADKQQAEESLKTAGSEELTEANKRLRLAEVRQQVADRS